MPDNNETLELIEDARKKACSLYASDKIASPLIKSIDLVERIVNGEATDSNLEDDVCRLIDEADYTRKRDENRDDPLRSVVLDLCKLIGFATRAISKGGGMETNNSFYESASRSKNHLAHIPKEEPGCSQTTIRVDAVVVDENTANLGRGETTGPGMIPVDPNRQFFNGSLFPDDLDDKETIKLNLNFTPYEDQTVKTEMDEWQIDPTYDPIYHEDELPQPPSSLKRPIDDIAGTSSASMSSDKRPCIDLSDDDEEEEKEVEEEYKDEDEDNEEVAFLCEKNPKRVNGYYGNFNCTKCKGKYTTRKTLFMHSFVHNQGPVQMFLDKATVIRLHQSHKSEINFSRILFDRVRLPNETVMRLEDRDRKRVDFVYECIRQCKEPNPHKIATVWKDCVRRYNDNLTRRLRRYDRNN